MNSNNGNDEALFIEIHPPTTVSTKPDRIEVATTTVDPKLCGPLLKELSKVAAGKKDEALAHLKRVKRKQYADQSDDGPPKKKAKIDLQVLLGRDEKEVARLVETYNLEPQRTLVPGRPAESKQELEGFNQIWPTIYFHKNTQEHRAQELMLSEDELNAMVRGMEHAVEDGAAVIVNPAADGVVVSKSQDELVHQGEASRVNPLCSPVLLAIQGVSRAERMAALCHGMDSDTFRTGQYLCTGFDIYLKREPDVFESMALVHSRIRRVVFGAPNAETGGIGGTGEASDVHSLPGTNHRYRAFVCAPGGRLRKACLQSDESKVT
jgi:tRNA-specific adenosine deaminase 3